MDEISTQLKALLEEEREALVAGNLDRLEEFTAEKDRLADAILAEGRPPLGPELKQMCSRNQELIAAALKGARAATKRLTELRAVQSRLSTYDQAGQKQIVSSAPSALEKKA